MCVVGAFYGDMMMAATVMMMVVVVLLQLWRLDVPSIVGTLFHFIALFPCIYGFVMIFAWLTNHTRQCK